MSAVSLRCGVNLATMRRCSMATAGGHGRPAGQSAGAVAGVSIAQSLERSARRVARRSIEEGAHASWALAVKVGCTGMPETVTEGMGGAPLATYASSMRRASSRGTKSRSTDCTHMNCKSRSVSTCRSTPAPCSDLSGALWKCAGD